MIYQIHLWGLYVTQFLQQRFQACDSIFTLLSAVTDPSALYTVYFPVTYALAPEVGLKVLHAAAAGEWMNLFMKWIFLGDRPYWWVHENHMDMFVKIRQFYNTCETGPGTPSGHVTIACMSFYILASAIATKLSEYDRSHITKVWITYGLVIFMLGISRAFIAAHFIHQCIFGFFSGFPFGKLINRMNLQNLKWNHYLLVTAIFIGSPFGLDLMLTVFGVDVTWTLQLAKKWCMKESWIHVATTPYYMMWRFSGATLGLGLVRRSQNFDKFLHADSSTTYKVVMAIAGLITSHFLMSLIFKTAEPAILYSTVFVVYMLNSYLIGIVLPALAYKI